MRKLSLLAIPAVLLSACSLVAPRQAQPLPTPAVQTGTTASAPTLRDVSEDALSPPKAGSAGVLVMSNTQSGVMVVASSSSGSGALTNVSTVFQPTFGSSGAIVPVLNKSLSGVVIVGSGTAAVSSSSSSSVSVAAGTGGALVAAPKKSSSSSSSVATVTGATVTAASSASDTMVEAKDTSVVTPPKNTSPSANLPTQKSTNNLVISLESDASAVPPGGMLQLSVPVRNYSAGSADGFLVEVLVPEGVTVVDAVLGEIDGRAVRWRFNSLLPNQMYTLHFAVRVARDMTTGAILPFSARVSGGNLGGSAVVTTSISVQQDLPQTGVDLGATLLGRASSSASGGERMVLAVTAMVCLALFVGLMAGRVLTRSRI